MVITKMEMIGIKNIVQVYIILILYIILICP